MKKEARGQTRPVAPPIAGRDALPRVRIPDDQQVVPTNFGQAESYPVKPVCKSGSLGFASDRLLFPGQNRSNKWKYTGKYRDKIYLFFSARLQRGFRRRKAMARQVRRRALAGQIGAASRTWSGPVKPTIFWPWRGQTGPKKRLVTPINSYYRLLTGSPGVDGASPPPQGFGETGRRGKSKLVKPSWSAGLMPQIVL